MTAQEEALNALRRYVQTQTALLSALQDHGSNQPLSVRLFNMPAHGVLICHSQEWQFTRHGSGVLFRELCSGRKVDVPIEVDNPEVFDLWRLGTYFGSLGRTGVKLLERASGNRGTTILHALETLLDAWQRSGEINGANGLFSFVVRE
jgi:hypothetical protein